MSFSIKTNRPQVSQKPPQQPESMFFISDEKHADGTSKLVLVPTNTQNTSAPVTNEVRPTFGSGMAIRPTNSVDVRPTFGGGMAIKPTNSSSDWL